MCLPQKPKEVHCGDFQCLICCECLGVFYLTVKCIALLGCKFLQVTGFVWLSDPLLPPFCICKVVHVLTSLSSFRSKNNTNVLSTDCTVLDYLGVI